MANAGWRRQHAEAAEGIIRQHHPDRIILVGTLILLLAGLLVIYAIGPQRAQLMNSIFGYNYSDQYFFQKQLISSALALVGFFAMTKIPYTWVLKHGSKVLWIGFIACALLAIGGWLHLIAATNGAVRWIDLGPLGSVQPAEILKFGILLYLAVFLGIRVKEGKVNDFKATLLPVTIITALGLLFVIVIQKDMGTGMSLTAISVTMLFVAGINRKVIFGLIGLLVLAGLMLIFTAPHRVERILTYLQGDNTTTTDADAYQVEHAKIAIGSGGLFGVGIGGSVQASGYLPEAINDSIFAIIGETFGFIGTVALLALFVALLMRLLTVMDHLVDIRLKLLAAGVFGWMGAHVILNIAAMIGIFPLTGITLPLLSYGGTSMIFMTAALGLIYQLSRYTAHPSRIKEDDYEDTRRGRGVGRTRYASRRRA
ncbi:MAG TPA: FtsW/RodA/SpoVE family cell cycle protein [Dongiaceae bacterium]|nr:FtsW/RodA/SpoVE family cell cycle protein [Dongiaceae bacterium]